MLVSDKFETAESQLQPLAIVELCPANNAGQVIRNDDVDDGTCPVHRVSISAGLNRYPILMNQLIVAGREDTVKGP